MDATPAILPHDRRAWFCRLFRWYASRLIRKNFNAMRLARGGARVLAELDSHDGPTMLLLNHQSWWDPILTAALADRCARTRQVFAPMDRAMVEQFKFMRKLGLFGVDLDDPGAFKAMVKYASELAASNPRPSFWITPQGGFADVRAPLELRPGAAAIASRLDSAGRPTRVVSLAVEYTFWEDRKPELLLLATPCRSPERSTTSHWQRRMTESLDATMRDLAKLSVARDPAAFETVLGRGSSGVNPVYDAVLRMTGRQASIESHKPRTEPSS
ncbi:MAG: lysophospholipid acyltransferase family protein [Phycisphaerales bacterium]